MSSRSSVPTLSTRGVMRPQPQRDRVSAPCRWPFSAVNYPARGAASAPVTVVEFIDYECPYCRKFSRKTFPQILDDINAGKVRWVRVSDLPLERQHPRARAEQWRRTARQNRAVSGR